LSSKRPTSSAVSRDGVDFGEGIGHQALKDAAGQGTHEDDAHSLLIGLTDHARSAAPSPRSSTGTYRRLGLHSKDTYLGPGLGPGTEGGRQSRVVVLTFDQRLRSLGLCVLQIDRQIPPRFFVSRSRVATRKPGHCANSLLHAPPGPYASSNWPRACFFTMNSQMISIMLDQPLCQLGPVGQRASGVL